MDHLQTGTLKCDKITCIVIDEADLMLDMGFLEDIKEILSYIENEKNIMFFLQPWALNL